MGKVRFKYSKTGRAKYISHLDLMATIQRSFLRSGINLKYSEGFNPHPYMSVALPLSVGCESLCELMDVSLTDGVIPDIKSIKLPEGIKIHDVYLPVRKFSEISWVEINGAMHYDNQASDDTLKLLQERFSEESIVISKRTKRGLKDLDIAPFIKDVDLKNGKGIEITAKISALNPTLNMDDLINALSKELKPEYTDMKRIAIYDSNMIIFR